METEKILKVLTALQKDRKNISNNIFDINKMQSQTGLRGIIFENKLLYTNAMVVIYFDVDICATESCVSGFKMKLRQ